jgi:FSR family fosmidomycin resistance protein-like MFS transporter
MYEAAFTLTLLAIEFLDEAASLRNMYVAAASSHVRSGVFGVREAAWPLIRTDLSLNYAQVGLLLGLPSLVSSLVEPFLGVLGDIWRHRVLILGGGVVFALALLLTALSQDFPVLLISFIIFYPASGAFVSLSQATLMDTDPARHEQNMARWTFAGSLGVVAVPVALGMAAMLGFGWRGLFLVFAGLTLIPLAMVYRLRSAIGQQGADRTDFKAGLVNALRALRRGEVLRWLTLLQFS